MINFCYLQRQQVVMTRKWAEKYPNIHFSSMHPGWADTPGNCDMIFPNICGCGFVYRCISFIRHIHGCITFPLTVISSCTYQPDSTVFSLNHIITIKGDGPSLENQTHPFCSTGCSACDLNTSRREWSVILKTRSGPGAGFPTPSLSFSTISKLIGNTVVTM